MSESPVKPQKMCFVAVFDMCESPRVVAVRESRATHVRMSEGCAVVEVSCAETVTLRVFNGDEELN